MRKIFILAIFGITSISAFGRIGDTYQQSVKRFGKPIIYFKDKYTEIGLFEKVGFSIIVKYKENFSIEERYAKLINEMAGKLKNEYIDGFKSSLLSNINNFQTLSNKQIQSLIKANSPSMTSEEENKLKMILGKGTSLDNFICGKNKCTYTSKYKFLQIKRKISAKESNNNISSKKQEIEALCLPLDCKYSKYVDKYGYPFAITPGGGYFDVKNIIINIDFYSQDKKHQNKSIRFLHKGKEKSKSCGVEYAILTNQARKKYAPLLKKSRSMVLKFKDKFHVTEEDRFAILEASIFPNGNNSNLQSMPEYTIELFLNSTTKTEWTKEGYVSLIEKRYYTWKNGRKILASYNLLRKLLSIELGYSPSDFKPEVIKKLKAQKEAKELESF